jgi:phage portal protein BeeE
MPIFRSFREQTRREAEQSYQRCRKTAAAGLGPQQLLLGNGSNLPRVDAEGRQQIADAKEQYGHFRGQVFTSIRPIAQRIAGQPVRLARIAKAVKGRGQRVVETRQFAEAELAEFVAKQLGRAVQASEQLEVVDQHPILDALHRPAESLPGWNDWCLKYVTAASLELTGHAYWWFPLVKGRKEIWHLPTHWVRPKNSTAGLFQGWILKAEGATEEREVAASEIAPFWYPDPRNPLHGLGPLEAGARSVMVDEFVVDAQKRAFQLGIHPGAVITVGSQATKGGQSVRPKLRQWQRSQITEAINARYRGMTHFGEAMILDALIEDIKPYGNTPKQMDFGGNADQAQARVEQTFGTNPYVVGASGLSSRAESAEADRHFCYSTVNPKIELLSRVLTIVVLPQFDPSGEFVLFIEPARPRDAEMEQKEWEDGLKNACITINEYRSSVLRQPPTTWGDAVVLPNASSVVPVSQLSEGAASAGKKAGRP